MISTPADAVFVDELDKMKKENVPYIKKSEYDQYANEILEKYYFNHHPEARVKPIPVNVDELAINMGLSVCDTSILLSEEGHIPWTPHIFF